MKLKNAQQMENDQVIGTQNSACTADERKEWLNPSHDKNKGMHRGRKVDEKSCVTPAGTSNKLDVQKKWEEKRKKCRNERVGQVAANPEGSRGGSTRYQGLK